MRSTSLLIPLIGLLFLAGCGKETSVDELGPSDAPPVGIPDANGVVVKSRAMMSVSTDSQTAQVKFMKGILSGLLPLAYAASGTQPVTVINAPSVSMTLDNGQFVIPAINNALLDFGFLNISALQDNNLKVCGSNGKQKCGTALIRIYTTGQSGAGMWNSVDQFGAPITAGMQNSALLSVGLGTAGAATVQTYAIPNNRNVVRLSDFTPTPHYSVKADFTDAGAGSYATTVVVEYVLAP